VNGTDKQECGRTHEKLQQVAIFVVHGGLESGTRMRQTGLGG
jgi:hypothetical protein